MARTRFLYLQDAVGPMPLPIRCRRKLKAIIRAEAVRVIGPWQLNVEVVVYPLDGSWRAMFGYSDVRQTDFKNRVAVLCEDLRKLYDLAEYLASDELGPAKPGSFQQSGAASVTGMVADADVR